MEILGPPSTTTSFLKFLSDGTQYGSINFNEDFGRGIGLLCTNATLPASSYATAEVKDNYIGVGQEFAHTRINTDIDFTFYIDRQYKVLGFLKHGWILFLVVLVVKCHNKTQINQQQGVITEDITTQTIIKLTEFISKSLKQTMQKVVQQTYHIS